MASTTNVPGAAGSIPTILVVDSDEPLCSTLKASFRAGGYHVFCASDPGTAWDMARRHLPDLIICDVDMPGKGSPLLLKELRSDPVLGSRQYVLMSGKGEPSDSSADVAPGQDDTFQKPFALAELFQCVAARLSSTPKISPAGRPAEFPDSLPLGRPIPGGPHSVSCSLPTLQDLIRYEEKDPALMARITVGYPRFVVHRFVRQLGAELARLHKLTGRTLWLTSSARMADELAEYLADDDVFIFMHGRIHGITHPDNPDVATRANTFLQHVGGFLSSREAEDALAEMGVLAHAGAEPLFAGDAAAEVRRVLHHAFLSSRRTFSAGPGDADLLLAPSGMNAVYAAFRGVSIVQAARGRTAWVQLGWLYRDTMAILKKFTPHPAQDYIHLPNVGDLDAVERVLAEHGPRIAGLVTEVPTNPLLQTCDLPALAALARRHGVRLIVDPTIASPFNLDVLEFADLVVTSLTKYAANEGDVIAGLVVVNSASPDAGALRSAVAAQLEPVYHRDLARLAAEIGAFEPLITHTNATTARVVEFLQKHPAVRQVYWPLQPGSRANYLKLARHADAAGAMISFTLNIPLEKFYDRVRIPKGPSFGMKNSLLCPFLYIAHYDLVSHPAGRAELLANGLDPELIRLSVGLEPAEKIIAVLAEALG
ncbi:MAG: PLP-dependent transferase [Opitutaceae bacterium]|nr:PLP-dependent transferase [Opitutaceae bacterium]